MFCRNICIYEYVKNKKVDKMNKILRKNENFNDSTEFFRKFYILLKNVFNKKMK